MQGPGKTRLERGDYFADVLEGNDGKEPFWYYILQRKGSNQIIDLMKFDAQEAAFQAAGKALASFGRPPTAG